MVKNIEIKKCDITALNIDIIVNAANRTLLGGGGVDGQIHKKAGKELLEECRKLNGCETGESKMTNAYQLPCKKIVHTVGPVYTKDNPNVEKLLSSCYKTSLELAEKYRKENKLDYVTIAFPCISTGVYHYPKREAASVVLKTLDEVDYPNINVIIACFLDEDYEIYKELSTK